MRILHYVIGLPPGRSGGSVIYARALMQSQQSLGHEVSALVCGETLFRSKSVHIQPVGKDGPVAVYSLEGPLTPSLVYPVGNPDAECRQVRLDEENLSRFLSTVRPDILHIHTFMGLPIQVVRFFKRHGVRIIYTTHDYHGLCPAYSMLAPGGSACPGAGGENCAACCAKAPADLAMRAVNSRRLRPLLRLGRRFRNIFPLGLHRSSESRIALRSASFDRWLKHFEEYFSLVDSFHFNSHQTRRVFESRLGALHGEVLLPVTPGIKDHRRFVVPGKVVKLGFIGSHAGYKGLPMLLEAMEALHDGGCTSVRLAVYGAVPKLSDAGNPLVEFRPLYNNSRLSEILYELDAVVVPSIWPEPFSLVAMEALAHGRPCLVSDRVGARDVVEQVCPEFLFSDQVGLGNLLARIAEDPEMLSQASERILAAPWPYDPKSHARKLANL